MKSEHTEILNSILLLNKWVPFQEYKGWGPAWMTLTSTKLFDKINEGGLENE